MNRLPGPLHPGRERAPASRAMRARGGPARPVASLAAIALMAGSIATALPTRALAATPLTSGQAEAEAVVQAYGQAVVSAREPSSVITAAGGCPPVFAAPSLPLELRRGPAAAYVLGVARGQTIHDPTHIISPAELFNAYEDERNAWSDTYWDLAAPQGTSSAPVLVPGSVFSPSDPLHLIPADKWYDPGVVASPDFVNWETARIRDFPYGFAAPLAPGFNWTTARIDRWELRRAVLYMYTGLDAGPPGPSFPTPGRSARFGPAATYDQAFQSLPRRQVADAVMALEVGRDARRVLARRFASWSPHHRMCRVAAGISADVDC